MLFINKLTSHIFTKKAERSSSNGIYIVISCFIFTKRLLLLKFVFGIKFVSGILCL